MPIAAALCALCAGLAMLMVGSYAVHKQNAVLHEQSIRLEWTLQNAEKKWYQDGKQAGKQEYIFPEAKAVINSSSPVSEKPVSRLQRSSRAERKGATPFIMNR